MTTEEELGPDRLATERATPEEPSLPDAEQQPGAQEREAAASSPTPAGERRKSQRPRAMTLLLPERSRHRSKRQSPQNQRPSP